MALREDEIHALLAMQQLLDQVEPGGRSAAKAGGGAAAVRVSVVVHGFEVITGFAIRQHGNAALGRPNRISDDQGDVPCIE